MAFYTPIDKTPAGFAKGLGVPVIFTCRESDFAEDKVQFDTRQYNHIVWSDLEDLKGKLVNRIEATTPIASSRC